MIVILIPDARRPRGRTKMLEDVRCGRLHCPRPTIRTGSFAYFEPVTERWFHLRCLYGSRRRDEPLAGLYRARHTVQSRAERPVTCAACSDVVPAGGTLVLDRRGCWTCLACGTGVRRYT